MKRFVTGLVVCGLSLLAQDAAKPQVATATREADKAAIPIAAAPKGNKAAIKLTLKEACETALRDNPTLATTKARIDAAVQAVREAKSGYYPTIDLGASATRLRDQDTRNSGTRDWKNQGDYFAGVSFDWLIFDGFQREFAVLEAKYGQVTSEEADRDARRLMLQAVSRAFYSALLNQDSMNISKEDADFNNILLEDAKKRYEGGIAKSSEVLNFILQVQNADVDYVTAENNWRISMIALAALLAVRQDYLWEHYELVPPATYNVSHDTIQDMYDYALQHRPDYRSAEAYVRICDDAIQAAKNTWYPTLRAFGDYNYERLHSMHFNSHYDRTISYGVSLTWNMFNGFKTQAQIAKAEAELIAAVKEKEDLKISIDTQIRQATLTLETSKKQLALQEVILETAMKIRNLVTEEYKGGTTTITRVNETQTDVTKAQSARSQAYVQLLNSIEDLNAVTGKNMEMLEKH